MDRGQWMCKGRGLGQTRHPPDLSSTRQLKSIVGMWAYAHLQVPWGGGTTDLLAAALVTSSQKQRPVRGAMGISWRRTIA